MTAKAKPADTLKSQQPKFTVIYNCAIGKLTPLAMAVFVVICYHANNVTKESYPGHERIAREARCSRSSVKRAVDELVKAKLISVRKVGREGMQHNEYTVLAPASTQAKNGGAVPTEPGCKSSKGGSNRTGTGFPQSPELDLRELDLEQGEHGFTGVKAISKSLSKKGKSKTQPSRAEKQHSVKAKPERAPRSSRGAWSSEEWEQLRSHLGQEQFDGIDYRDNIQRDRGALRSLHAVTNGSVEQACSLLDQASAHLGASEEFATFDQLIAIATGLAERENGTNSSRHQQEEEQFARLTRAQQDEWVYSTPAERAAMLGGAA